MRRFDPDQIFIDDVVERWCMNCRRLHKFRAYSRGAHRIPIGLSLDVDCDSDWTQYLDRDYPTRGNGE
jgi:hypothetical protein